MLRHRFASAYLAFTMTLAASLAAHADDPRIGAAAAVVPATSGTSVGGLQMQIIDGSNVFHRERVVTEAEGRAQLIFLDGSAVTIGPRSEVTLDEFVYDPEQRLAGATINASRGVLRYVGGKISKTVDVKINTPTATIGVRGGIVVVDIEQSGRTNAFFLYGDRMTVTADGATEVAQRPGSVISFTPGRGGPTPPRLASPGEMRQALNGLQAPPPQQNQPGQPRPGQAQPAGNRPNQPPAQNPQQPNQQAGNQPGQQGQPPQNQPGQNPPPANQQAADQPGQAPQPAPPPGQARATANGPAPAPQAMPPGGGPGQPGLMGNLERGAQIARQEGNLPRDLGRNNSRMGPGNIAPPTIGNFGRVGPPGPQPNGPTPPVGPGLGPRPLPLDGIPRLAQQGTLPPPPPPPQ